MARYRLYSNKGLFINYVIFLGGVWTPLPPLLIENHFLAYPPSPNVVIQVIYITCITVYYSVADRSLCFQFSSLLMMWHWFSGHVSLTLPGNFCMRMAAMRGKQPGMVNCTGRADNTKENTKQEDLLIQEYCILVNMSKLFLSRCRKWPRAFLCKYLKLLSNLLKDWSSKASALPAIPKNPFQPQLPPWLLQPQLPPWVPQSQPPLLPAAGRPLLRRPGTRCHPLGAIHCQKPGPGNSPGVQGCTSQPPSLQQPCRTLRSSHMVGKERVIS